MLNLSKIKPLLRQRGMTAQQVAKELGITVQALCKMTRENTTKISTLEQIAKLLDVPVSYFFDEEIATEEKTEPLTPQEQTELAILRERVESLIIARDALQGQVDILKEQLALLKHNSNG